MRGLRQQRDPARQKAVQFASLVRDVRADRNVGIFAVYNRDRVDVIANQILGGLRLADQNDDRICAGLTGLTFDRWQDILFTRVDATGALDDTDLTVLGEGLVS